MSPVFALSVLISEINRHKRKRQMCQTIIEFELHDKEVKNRWQRQLIRHIFGLTNQESHAPRSGTTVKVQCTAEQFGLWIIERNNGIQHHGGSSNNILSLNAKVIVLNERVGPIIVPAYS